MYSIAAEIDRRADDFIAAEVADTGKPWSLASPLDIPRGAANLRVFVDVVRNVPTETFTRHAPDGKPALNYALRRPKGIVAVVCPWNLPLLLMTWKVGPALACGNTVIVKPSEETPATAALLGEVMNKVGVPKGVYNVVHGFGPDSAGAQSVYVQRPIFDAVVQRLVEAARQLKPGRSQDKASDFGPLISAEHQSKVLGYYKLVQEEGATAVCGGGVPAMPADLQGGAWIEPTVWTGLAHGSRVATEEIFDPCCAVIPFDPEAEVMRMASDTPYGLAASVYTRDIDRAHRVAGALKVGIAWVNTWFLRNLRTVFGGSGSSGIGHEGGVHSLEFYTELSNVCIKFNGDRQ